MPTLRGHCSCGAVEYEFSTDSLRAYQCHCSICRNASGSAYSTTLMAPESKFTWIRGTEYVSSYAKENGYKVNFCSRCGNPVPNKFRNFPLYSVPVGGLEGTADIEVVAKIYLGSRAAWDKDQFQGKSFVEMPSFLETMLELLHAHTEP